MELRTDCCLSITGKSRYPITWENGVNETEGLIHYGILKMIILGKNSQLYRICHSEFNALLSWLSNRDRCIYQTSMNFNNRSLTFRATRINLITPTRSYIPSLTTIRKVLPFLNPKIDPRPEKAGIPNFDQITSRLRSLFVVVDSVTQAHLLSLFTSRTNTAEFLLPALLDCLLSREDILGRWNLSSIAGCLG